MCTQTILVLVKKVRKANYEDINSKSNVLRVFQQHFRNLVTKHKNKNNVNINQWEINAFLILFIELNMFKEKNTLL